MAIETGNGNYRGVLYKFEEDKEGNLEISDMNYSPTSGYREPDEVTIDSSNGIPEGTLQGQFNAMVGRVSEKGGFWVGRYETSNMVSDNTKDSTNKITVIKGTITGINTVNWYRMYVQQKNYSKLALTNGTSITSSMIWGSQWDQIMIWMKDVPSAFTNTTYTGKFYITNAVGKGNFGVDNKGTEKATKQIENTGFHDVKNIYDLAGNVYEWTLEAYTTDHRVLRRRRFHLYG